MDKVTYSPQITEGNNDLTPPPATPHPVLRRSTVVLTYPFVSPTTTLTIRTPDLGDKKELTYDRIYFESRGLTPHVYRDSNWQKRKILSLSFRALTKTQAADFEAFLKQSLGKVIGYLDYNSWQWSGVIVDPNQAIQEVFGTDCYYAISLTFRGQVESYPEIE